MYKIIEQVEDAKQSPQIVELTNSNTYTSNITIEVEPFDYIDDAWEDRAFTLEELLEDVEVQIAEQDDSEEYTSSYDTEDDSVTVVYSADFGEDEEMQDKYVIIKNEEELPATDTEEPAEEYDSLGEKPDDDKGEPEQPDEEPEETLNKAA